MNAIKLTFVSKFLSILFLCGFVQISFAQHEQICDRSTIISICEGNNWGAFGASNSDNPSNTTVCGDAYVNAYPGRECGDGYIPLTIYCTNIPGDPDDNGYYSWPEDMEPLHIEYDYSPVDVAYTSAITRWQYVGDIPGTDDVSYAAQTTIYSEVLTGDYCPGLMAPNFNFQIRVKLVTPGDFEMETYPIEDYAGPDGIFSCEVFEETCFLCVNDLDFECRFLLEPEYDINICMDCTPCHNTIPKVSGTASRETLELEEKNLSIQPNPFSDQFEYTFFHDAEETIGQSNIFNAQGKMIWSEAITIKNGSNIFYAQPLEIAAGLYFLEIKTPTGNQVTQIVKLD